MSNASQLPPLYPLRFKDILRNYSFGDRWIVREFAKVGLPDDHRVGETWEVCDRPTESSVAINGPLAGKTLHELIELYGEALLGEAIVRRFGKVFPLLLKFLDATHILGEQVHPGDELTRRRGLKDFFGKTEAWYMLRTAPGATIECGNRDGVTRETLIETMLAAGSRPCMVEYPVQPGDAFLLYAGTMHYSKGGVLFFEIMQNSDVYQGVGRPKTDLPEEERMARAQAAAEAVHLEDRFDPRPRPVTLTDGPNRRTFVMACDKFALERLDLAGPATLDLTGERFCVLTLIAGEAKVRRGSTEEVLRPGHSCLLPACIGPVAIEPAGQASLLKAYVPDLVKDIIGPLRAAGVGDEAIRWLGGRTRLNSLGPLL